jgi:hypothetical protein
MVMNGEYIRIWNETDLACFEELSQHSPEDIEEIP